MIKINFKKRFVLDHLKIGETFKLADTFYLKTNFKRKQQIWAVNLESGKITKFHENQTVIPKEFVLTTGKEG